MNELASNFKRKFYDNFEKILSETSVASYMETTVFNVINRKIMMLKGRQLPIELLKDELDKIIANIEVLVMIGVLPEKPTTLELYEFLKTPN